MDSQSSSPGFERIDENLRAIQAFLDERDARRKAGLLARERPPEDVYLQLDERLRQFQEEMKAFREETRLTLASLQEHVATELASLQDRVATRVELASLQERVATRVELASLQERVATRVELESVRDDIRIVAEGFADIRTKLDDVARLLGQYITAR
jgi:hypothetical protein